MHSVLLPTRVVGRVVVACGVITACVCGTTGCSTGPSYREAPTWLHTLPLDDVYLYAVGSYVGSLDPNDNHENALKAAASRLAAAFRTHIISTSEVRTTMTTTRLREFTEAATATLLRQMEHLATWVDVEGEYSRHSTVWVLVRAPKALNLGTD